MTFMIDAFNYNMTNFMGLPYATWTNICVIIFIMWVIFAYIIPAHGIVIFNKYSVFQYLFILMSFISLIYTYNFNDTLDRVKRLLIVFILYICIYQFASEKENLRKCLKMYVWAAFAASVYMVSGSDLSARIGGLLGDANQVGITLAFAATVAMYVLKTEAKIIYILPIILQGYAILFTGSRTAFVLLLLAIVCNICISAYQYHWKIRYILLAAIIMAGIIYGIFYAVMNMEILYDILGIRIESFIAIMQGETTSYQETSTQFRLIYMRRAFEWFLQSPLWGNGIGAFASYNDSFIDGRYCFSHCDYTELLSALGLPGFILFFYPLLIYIRSIFDFRGVNISREYRILLGSLTIEFLVGEVFLVMHYQKETWILLALLACIYKVSRNNDRGVLESSDE